MEKPFYTGRKVCVHPLKISLSLIVTFSGSVTQRKCDIGPQQVPRKKDQDPYSGAWQRVTQAHKRLEGYNTVVVPQMKLACF